MNHRRERRRVAATVAASAKSAADGLSQSVAPGREHEGEERCEQTHLGTAGHGEQKAVDRDRAQDAHDETGVENGAQRPDAGLHDQEVEGAVGDQTVRRNDVGVRFLAAHHLGGHHHRMTIFEEIGRGDRRRHLQHRQRIREDDDRIDDPARKAEFRPRENERRYEDDAQRDRRAGLLRKPADLRDERQRSGDERLRNGR